MARAKGRDAEPRASWRRRIFRGLVYWSAVAGIWAVIGLIGLVAYYAYELPDVQGPGRDLANQGPLVRLTYTDGSALATLGGAWGEEVPYDQLPKSLIDAVVATEDRRFFDHVGLDVIGLLRAAFANLRAGRVVQGGSTITQQLAKNVFLTPERSLRRKLLEVMMAFWLEAKFDKQEILSLYLNRVYLGAGAYGVDAAARRYFGVPVARLNLAQSAVLAGLLKAPSRYAPTRNPKLSARRSRQVLDNMVAAGVLAPDKAAAAKRALKTVLARIKAPARRTKAGGARYFSDWVHGQLADYVSQSGREIVVRTTLDRRLQAAAKSVVAKALSGEGKKHDAHQAALVAMTPSGAVRAMVGGRSFAESQFNRAVQARRHAGSTFKMFVYLAALEAGLKTETVLLDGPITVDGWSPRNVGEYQGKVTLNDALARSLNSVPVKISREIGLDAIIDAARRLGLGGRLEPHPSLVLGAADVSLLELTGSYAVIAGGGLGVWPHAVEQIRDAKGKLLYSRSGGGPGRVVDALAARELAAMLQAVVLKGTGRRAGLKRPAAGKTGTSQDYRDAWFIGFSADLVAGVWFGNDNGQPMKKVTGGGLPAQSWAKFMAAAHRGKPARALLADAPKAGGTWLEKVLGGKPTTRTGTRAPNR